MKTWKQTLALGLLLGVVLMCAFGARIGTHGPRMGLLDSGPSGRAVAYPYDEFVYAVKSDGGTYRADGSTLGEIQDGTTLELKADWGVASKCMKVETEGTWAGSTDVKTVRLTAVDGATTVDVLSLPSKAVTDKGDLMATFHLCLPSGTTYEVWGSYMLSDGATLVAFNSRASGTATFTEGMTLKTRWSVAGPTSVAIQNYGKFTFEP